MDNQTFTVEQRTVRMGGVPVPLVGNEINVGDRAPDFTAITTDSKEVTLSSFKEPVLVLSAVPSLDTSVCNRETRRFAKEGMQLGDKVRIVTISEDLPFAQRRWCEEAKIEGLQTVSDHRTASFGMSYGVLMKEQRLLARCVFVLDKDRRVQYKELVSDVSKEPDYDRILQKVKELAARS